MSIASSSFKVCCLILLVTGTGSALAQSDKALEARETAWLAKQPATVQRTLRAHKREWKICPANFARRSAATEAATAAKLSSPTFYKVTSGGVFVSSSVQGLCPSRIAIFPKDIRFIELDAKGSNPGDGMVMWSGARETCFTAATRFAERFNRELARLRPTEAKAICLDLDRTTKR